MTRKSLARDIAKKTKLTVRKAENLVIAFGAVITDALSRGDKVIYSNFGTFYTCHYPSKTINHPRFGGAKKMIMLPTDVAKWMPADNIKKMTNSGEVVDMPTLHKSKKIFEDTSDKKSDLGSSLGRDGQDTNKPQVPNDQNLKPNEASSANQASKANGSDDDLDKYLASKKTQKAGEPVNVYDEILKDGSHEFSTVQGAIKVHNEDKEKEKEKEKVGIGPFASLKDKLGFAKREEKPANPYAEKVEVTNQNQQDDQNDKDKVKVSLADAGIFGKESTLETAPKSLGHGEQRINQIKDEVGQESVPPKQESVSPKGQLGEQVKAAQIEKSEPKNISQEKINIQYQDLSKVVVPKELLSRIPENIARRYKAVPIEDQENAVAVAMVDPEDIETKEIFKRLLGKNISIKLATESDINHVLSQYQGLESEVSSAIAKVGDEEKEKEEEDKKKPTDKKAQAEAVTDDAPASRIVTSLLKRAIRDKASDVHIEPSEAKVEVRFRLDGVLRKKVSLPKEIQAAVVSRIKILSNMKIDEQRVPQDGRFNLVVDGRRIDFRVSSMPVANGEKVVMRILDKETGVLTIEELGVEGTGKKTIEDNLTKNHGMVLVTGPTGSGKTTTLYAMISKIFNEGVNIVTLEDPIEYQIKGINQSQVNSEIGYSFANGLRSILRQDPDVIMLGEIRDKETAEMAVHAALTGHVVLSTLHTNNAAGAIPRLIDMGVEPFLLTSSINVIIGQRLCRTICPDCKEEVKLNEEEIKAIQTEIDKMPAKEKEEIKKKSLNFFKGKGCKSCDESGYKGRIGIYEVLNVTEPIKDLTLKRVPASQIEAKGIEEGMLTMTQDGIKKALEGKTSMEEIWRVTKE